jgi:LPXTG-motif cell wall-anchored protein
VSIRPIAELSLGSATRTSATTATIEFTTSQPGKAYYMEVDYVPTSWEVVSANRSFGIFSGSVTDKAVGLSGEGVKHIYVVVVDTTGESDVLDITINKYDNTAPTIDTITPNGIDSDISGMITITFDEPMDISSGYVTLTGGAGNVGSFNVANWTDNVTYEVAYSGLENNTEYTINFNDFKDSALNALDSGIARIFTTSAKIDIELPITVDKHELIAYIEKIYKVYGNGAGGLDIHEENYVAENVEGLMTAYTYANKIIADSNATQIQIDVVLANIKKVYEELSHDHPVIKHTHDTGNGGNSDGLTKFEESIVIEIKGDIRDVSKFSLNGKDYPITAGDKENTYDIHEGNKVIGQITKGSAVVTLSTQFANRLGNGTHILKVLFDDQYAGDDKYGTASIVVNRKKAVNPEPNQPDDKKGGTNKDEVVKPVNEIVKTGDINDPLLPLVVGVDSLLVIISLVVLRKKKKYLEGRMRDRG